MKKVGAFSQAAQKSRTWKSRRFHLHYTWSFLPPMPCPWLMTVDLVHKGKKFEREGEINNKKKGRGPWRTHPLTRTPPKSRDVDTSTRTPRRERGRGKKGKQGTWPMTHAPLDSDTTQAKGRGRRHTHPRDKEGEKRKRARVTKRPRKSIRMANQKSLANTATNVPTITSPSQFRAKHNLPASYSLSPSRLWSTCSITIHTWNGYKTCTKHKGMAVPPPQGWVNSNSKRPTVTLSIKADQQSSARVSWLMYLKLIQTPSAKWLQETKHIMIARVYRKQVRRIGIKADQQTSARVSWLMYLKLIQTPSAKWLQETKHIMIARVYRKQVRRIGIKADQQTSARVSWLMYLKLIQTPSAKWLQETKHIMIARVYRKQVRRIGIKADQQTSARVSWLMYLKLIQTPSAKWLQETKHIMIARVYRKQVRRIGIKADQQTSARVSWLMYLKLIQTPSAKWLQETKHIMIARVYRKQVRRIGDCNLQLNPATVTISRIWHFLPTALEGPVATSVPSGTPSAKSADGLGSTQSLPWYKAIWQKRWPPPLTHRVSLPSHPYQRSVPPPLLSRTSWSTRTF